MGPQGASSRGLSCDSLLTLHGTPCGGSTQTAVGLLTLGPGRLKRLSSSRGDLTHAAEEAKEIPSMRIQCTLDGLKMEVLICQEMRRVSMS